VSSPLLVTKVASAFVIKVYVSNSFSIKIPFIAVIKE